MSVPKVSVIVPIYGVEKYLKECLDSLVNQTLKELEIILIDDGGKDNCPQIIDEYATRDGRIISIHKPNGGYGQSCNVGLEKAAGEYIAILEPDDYILPRMYEDLYRIAKENNSDIVKSPFYDNLQSSTKTTCNKIDWHDCRLPQDKSFTILECPLFLFYHPSVWSCIYKREFLNNNNIRFVEAPGSGWTDNPFQVQTMCLAKRINYTPIAYYYWRRLNENPCDDLKDWTLPFKRSDEIHNWLEENKIDDERILKALYKREFDYIQTVLDKKYSKQEIKLVLKEINKMTSRMDENLIRNNEYICSHNKKKLLKIKKHLNRMYYIKELKEARKNLISIHLNKNEKQVKLFGKTWRFN